MHIQDAHLIYIMSTTIIHKKINKSGRVSHVYAVGNNHKVSIKNGLIVETKGRGNSKEVENAFLFGAVIRSAL